MKAYIDGLLKGYNNTLDLIYSFNDWENNEYLDLIHKFILIKLSYFNNYKNIFDSKTKHTESNNKKYYRKGMISAYSSIQKFIKTFDIDEVYKELKVKKDLYICFNNSFYSLSDMSENKLNY